jgi:hypothetical protein
MKRGVFADQLDIELKRLADGFQAFERHDVQIVLEAFDGEFEVSLIGGCEHSWFSENKKIAGICRHKKPARAAFLNWVMETGGKKHADKLRTGYQSAGYRARLWQRAGFRDENTKIWAISCTRWANSCAVVRGLGPLGFRRNRVIKLCNFLHIWINVVSVGHGAIRSVSPSKTGASKRRTLESVDQIQMLESRDGPHPISLT